MASRSSVLSLRCGGVGRRAEWRRVHRICSAVAHPFHDPPEYDHTKTKLKLETPKHAYGLSVRQMAAMGLTGDRVQERFQVDADALTFKSNVRGEVVNANTRIATRMAVARPEEKSPPDLPSLILDGRIVYIGTPLVPSASELVICELLWLNYDQSEKPVYIYVNSTGSQTPDGQAVGMETEAFAIMDTMNYIRPTKYTIALTQAYGNAALILASGRKGYRYSMPNTRIKLQAPIMNQSYDISVNATIKANELQECTNTYVEFMSQFTGRDLETVRKESTRDKYYTPEQAIEYGLIDKIMQTEESMMMERDYDHMLVQSQAMERRMGGGGGDGPSTGAE